MTYLINSIYKLIELSKKCIQAIKHVQVCVDKYSNKNLFTSCMDRVRSSRLNTIRKFDQTENNRKFYALLHGVKILLIILLNN